LSSASRVKPYVVDKADRNKFWRALLRCFLSD
jgi:hypothetical protein